LPESYINDYVLLVADEAARYRLKWLKTPLNIKTFSLPSYTSEMNLVEQACKGTHKYGFKNEIFSTLTKVIERLYGTICSLSVNTIKNITHWN